MSTATCGTQWLCYHGNVSAHIPCGPLWSPALPGPRDAAQAGIPPGTDLGRHAAQGSPQVGQRAWVEGTDRGRDRILASLEFETFCKWQREGKKER